MSLPKPPEMVPEEMDSRDASDLEVLVAVLPDRIQDALATKADLSGLLEVVRCPRIRCSAVRPIASSSRS